MLHPTSESKRISFGQSRFVRTIGLVILLATYLAHPPLLAKDVSQTIKVASFEWPNKTQADGGGAYLDLLRAVYEPHGYQIQPVIMPIREIHLALLAGEVDIMLADWAQKHLSDDEWGDVSLIHTPYYPIDTEYVVALFPVGTSESYEDTLKRKSSQIAWVQGYGYEHYLDLLGHSFSEVPDNVTGLKLLMNSKLDVFIDDLDDVRISLRDMGLDQTSITREIIYIRNLYPVFHRDNSKIIQLYDQEVAKMIISEEIFPIYRDNNLNYWRIKYKNPDEF